VNGFRKRWNVEANDEQRLGEFRNRVLHTVASLVGPYLLAYPHWSNDYLKIVGKPPDFDTLFMNNVTFTPVWHLLENSTGMQELVFLLEGLFHLPIGDKGLEQLTAGLNEDITASGVPIVLAHNKGYYLFYKKGVKLLDELVVNADLVWLSDYPKALTAFENALIQSSDSAKQREVLDSLRVSLESLLKQLLGNRRSLENNKENLLKWMDERGTNTETRQMMSQLFQSYCNYQNNHVKHDDSWQPVEVDFILYLTATFIHLLAELNS
jgi:hypothetical protein